MQNLHQNAPGWDPAAGPALVLGAGGAARAIIVSLIDAGCAEVIVANRTRARADALAREFPISVVNWENLSGALLSAMTVVNTTSLGMTGQPALQIDLTPCPQSCLVTDIVYAPLETELLRQARELGMLTVDGLGMLLHQAVPGFEAWFGQRPSVTDELRAKVLAA